MDISSKFNIIPIYFRNILYDTESNRIKLLIIFVLIAACIAFLHGIIKEQIISPTSIVVMVITSTFTYMYFKKTYSKKYKSMKNKIKSLGGPTILDELCTSENIADNDRNKDICVKYVNTKKDFYKISDLLLKQFQYQN